VTDPERILVVRLSHLGDIVQALPVFHALRAAYPHARIAWAAESAFAPLLEGMIGLERVIPFDRGGGLRAWFRLRAALREFAPDLAVDAQGNLKSALCTLVSGAARRTGSARTDWRERAGAWVIGDPAPAVGVDRPHAMQRVLVLAAHVAGPAAHPPRTDAGLSPEERALGERRLAEHLPEARTGDTILHLSPAQDVRAWSEAGWCALARALCERGCGVLVLSGPAEVELGRLLADSLPAHTRLHHWVGQRGLRELAALFEAAAPRGLALVGCDSGPVHLAAASGLRTVLLAGPQDERRTGPWSPLAPSPHRTVRARQSPSCAPCLARTCHHPHGKVCMNRIDAADVLAALD
jgi:ADP-heptose:LPS heptosyltransferase